MSAEEIVLGAPLLKNVNQKMRSASYVSIFLLLFSDKCIIIFSHERKKNLVRTLVNKTERLVTYYNVDQSSTVCVKTFKD